MGIDAGRYPGIDADRYRRIGGVSNALVRTYVRRVKRRADGSVVRADATRRTCIRLSSLAKRTK